MPEPRLPMRKVRDVLRLSAAGLSKRKIAASLGMVRRPPGTASGAHVAPALPGRCRRI